MVNNIKPKDCGLSNEELKIINKVAEIRNGRIEVANGEYENLIYREDGICLLFYPHKCPSATGHVTRLRDRHSKDKTKAFLVMNIFRELGCKYKHGIPIFSDFGNSARDWIENNIKEFDPYIW